MPDSDERWCATLLALDPSFTATGWAVFDLASDRAIAAGVIRTAPPKKADRKRALVAEHDARRGLLIRDGVAAVMVEHQPLVVVQEAAAGSKSARAAGALARAQQACVDAIRAELGSLPVFVSVAACKKVATGKLSGSKEAIEAGVRGRFRDDWDALLERVARGKRENAFDAAAAYWAAYQEPAVAMAR